jgi:hypothetical protein
MSPKKRALLGFVGFILVFSVVTSDRFSALLEAVPEGLYYWSFIVLLALMIVVGFYSWWQRFHGRELDPKAARLKELVEKRTWWNWPF